MGTVVQTRGYNANSTATIQVIPNQFALGTSVWPTQAAFVYRPRRDRPLDLQALIADLRSSPEGGKAWSRVTAEKRASLDDAVEKEEISKIKYYRYIRRLSQKELARRVGTRQSNISRYEKPSYRPSRATLEKLARAFEIELADLL